MADPLPPHGGAGGGGGGGTASAAEWQAKSPVHYRTYTNAKDKSVLLRKAAGESKTEIDGLDDDVSALQGAIAGHANALSMYKHQIRVKEEECRELSQDLKASRAEAEHLRAKLRGAEECTSHAEAGRRKAVAAAAAAEEDASNKEARAKDLQLRLEGLDAELCAANQRVCSADTETAELRRRLMGAEAAAETAQSKADALAHQLSGVQEQMQDVAHANATMERRAVEDQHKMIELGSLLKRSEAAQEQLQSKLARADATVQELRRDSGEITRLKMALGEAKRATHAALTSKNGVGIELARAEDALHAALAEGTLSERLRDEAFAAHALHDAAAAKLAACEEALLRAQAEVEGLGLRCEAAERHAAEEEKARARLQEDMGMLAHDAKALHDNETLRRADDAELEALRAEVCERRTQCEELAMGVEQLHQKLERESAQRVELEAVRDELLALERSGAAGSKATLQQLVDDRSVLEQQLAQVVGTLDMLWGELAPAVIPRYQAGAPPEDGQLTAIAVNGARMIQRAIATGAKLKGLVKAYLGVLGEGTRLNAEAAMVAEATDETDDFEVSIQLSQLILEKLVADVASARRTIEDQNVLLHTTATEHVSLYPSPLARAASIAARRT